MYRYTEAKITLLVYMISTMVQWGVTIINQLSLSLSSLRRLHRNDGDVQSGFQGDIKLFRADGSGVGMEEACGCSLRN